MSHAGQEEAGEEGEAQGREGRQGLAGEGEGREERLAGKEKPKQKPKTDLTPLKKKAEEGKATFEKARTEANARLNTATTRSAVVSDFIIRIERISEVIDDLKEHKELDCRLLLKGDDRNWAMPRPRYRAVGRNRLALVR